MFMSLLCRDEFRVCVTSQLPLENIQEYLFGITPFSSSCAETSKNEHDTYDGKNGNLPDIALFKLICVQNDEEEEEEDNVVDDVQYNASISGITEI